MKWASSHFDHEEDQHETRSSTKRSIWKRTNCPQHFNEQGTSIWRSITGHRTFRWYHHLWQRKREIYAYKTSFSGYENIIKTRHGFSDASEISELWLTKKISSDRTWTRTEVETAGKYQRVRRCTKMIKPLRRLVPSLTDSIDCQDWTN